MNPIRLALLSAGLALLAGCATPPEVKQALAAKDQTYDANAELMDQYRELVVSVNRRYGLWHRYLNNLELLDLALQWATTDPPHLPDGPSREELATISQKLIVGQRNQDRGKAIMKLVNEIRLKGLPERKGIDGTVIFAAGKSDMTRLLQALPGLTSQIEEKVHADYREVIKDVDMSAFDDYKANVAGLRRINSMVKRYLDIDVTVPREDVKQLADAIKTLQ